MRTFDNLVFKSHPNMMGGVQALMKLKNGYEISVVGGGRGLYGDGINTFEVAVFNRQGDMINLSDHDQVMGYLNKNEVTDIIQKYDNEPILTFDLKK